MVVPNGTTIFISVAPHSVAPCRLDVAAQAVKRCRRRLLDWAIRITIYTDILIFG